MGLLPQVVGVGQLASLAWEGDVRPLPGEEADRNGARMPERSEILSSLTSFQNTGFSSEIGTKLCDWAVGHAGGSCYSRAALSSNDSKTR